MVYRSAVAGCRAGALGATDQHRTTRNYTGLEKQTLGRHKQNSVHNRTQEKGAVTPQETGPNLPVSVQESLVGQQSGFRPNNREGTQPRPSIEKWIKDLLSMTPPIRTRPSFPPSQSLPSGSFHKPLILIHQRADRMKTTVTENYQTDHMDHSLV